MSRASFVWLTGPCTTATGPNADATSPAFVAIEIVSPDDRYNDLIPRLEDYRRWGVPHVRLVNPFLKRLYEYTDAGLLQHPTLTLTGFVFSIPAAELLKDL